MQKANHNKKAWIISAAIAGFIAFSGNEKTVINAKEEPFAPASIDAADSILSTLSDEERIAQLFVVRFADSSDYNAGGYLISSAIELKHKSNHPRLKPFIGIDLLHENEFSSAINQEMIAACNNQNSRQLYLNTLSRNYKKFGVNFVLGPALDLYENVNNPYTNFQSFGDDEDVVASISSEFVGTLKANGIMCVAGSFPGLGSSERGFESNAPMLFSHSREMFKHEFVPFKTLINSGLQSIIVANAIAPDFDSTSNELTSGSNKIYEALKTNLGYRGLIWADLSKDGSEEEIDRSAMNLFLAGADVIIINSKLNQRVSEINTAVNAGIIDRETIDKKVKRIILSKLWLQRQKQKFTSDSTSNAIENELAQRKLVESSLTLLQNKNNIIPITHLDTVKLAVLRISNEKNENLDWLYNRYAKVDVYQSNFEALEKTFSSMAEKLDQYNLVIVISDEEPEVQKKRFGMSSHLQSVLDRLVYSKPTILAWTGNPNAFRNLNNTDRYVAVIEAFEHTPYTDDLLAQAIFGGRAMDGSLKRKVKDIYEKNEGLSTEKIRLGYGIPEEVDIQRKDLDKLNQIAEKGITEMAYPGCQVFFAKDGIVVVNNAYGYHQYEKEHKVQLTDLYDLASITKIAGSTAGLMELTSEGKFSLDSTLSYYLGNSVDTSKYANLTMREILAHQAGLAPFVPFYSKTLSKGVPRFDVYSLAQSETYPTRVAREFYILKDYQDVMFSQILNHPLSDEKKYKYSDIGYYFALRIIEKQSGMKMDHFLDSALYRPLGLSKMTYKPLEKFGKNQITPTEFDRDFRHQLIHGDVHDPGAAMLGGVGGHAGLFSNANDLGILMQMFLNGGDYGGQHYIDSAVLADYIRCQYCDNDNRRGAGFDKPLRGDGAGPSCGCTNKEAFGHQGFTGTVTWADPGEDVVYVFLSNRVYPSANNKKLAEMNIRTDMQKAFYDAILKGKEIAKSESEN